MKTFIHRRKKLIFSLNTMPYILSMLLYAYFVLTKIRQLCHNVGNRTRHASILCAPDGSFFACILFKKQGQT